MLEKFKALLVEEEGQGMVEYGLIIGLVSVVAIVTLTLVGSELQALFGDIFGELGGDESELPEE
ncbi:Flp family type IVb pilin [Alkalibacillus haloalkaliphilus]|uniref:Flp family type IVb pilin n=1 Tax=Alkalibacillus haloalkaliphilus TaxID=94136 RepID=A0A511W6V4_9BACI|nr:Flp family type IVb pilin [Alkalibacillus haloalkaliphilus]GEN45082.1 hypothetical protein AHA02nite_08580 [Alkalibacillus haloalkaliphilus]